MHRLCLHGILLPKGMVPIRNRSIGYPMEFHQGDQMAKNSRLLLRNECQFYLLLLERLMFQHRQSTILRDSVRCIAGHPSLLHEIDRLIGWSQSIHCRGCVG